MATSRDWLPACIAMAEGPEMVAWRWKGNVMDEAIAAETRRLIVLYVCCSLSACFVAIIALFAVRAASPSARVVYTRVPWVEIYNACQGGWSVDGSKGQRDGREIRTERMKICGKIATEAVAKGLAS